MGGVKRTIDPAVRAEAVAIGREHGAAEAGRRTGIKAATIRAWLHREAKARPGQSPVDSRSWGEQVEELARESFAAAAVALAEFRKQIDSGRATNAKNAAIAQGVLIDQVEKLRRIAADMAEREVEMTEEQAAIVAAAMGAIFEDLGLREVLAAGTPGAKVVRHHLLAPGKADGPAPEAGEAREALRRLVLAEANAVGLLERRPELPLGDGGPRELTPPPDDDDVETRAQWRARR
jgi:DNA-directed RNA polymerase specialized sigma24 family protein